MRGKLTRDTSIAKKIAIVVFIVIIDLLAFSLSYLSVLPVFNIPAAIIGLHIFNFIISSILPVIILAIFGAYNFKNLKNFFRLIYLSALSLLISFLFNIILDKVFFTARSLRYLFYYFLSSFFIVISLRLVYFFGYHIFLRIKHKSDDSEPALIIGAGFTGRMVYNELYHYESKFVPICFVDDDENKIGTFVQGLRVLGPTVIIPEIVKKFNIKSIIFAIPSCSEVDRNRILKYCSETDCEISVLTSGNEMIDQKPTFAQMSKVDINALIGSDDAYPEFDKIKKSLHNKSCLVTGSGGSIGAELCRQISKCDIKKLVLLDINENGVFDVFQELVLSGVDASKLSIEIASIRDAEKLEELFKKYSFDLVFHAAAHKHVPLMEASPEEAVKNNCIATDNLAKLCEKYSATKMIFISTDKAASPDNVMAESKRIAEILLKSYNHNSKCEFKNVRFGNIIGTNGSVIQLFIKQINNGGPVTVTHPEATRCFMTISECVYLILKTSLLKNKSTTYTLDTGKQVKILTLAENLINMCGYEPYKDIDITFTGLRPGESIREKTFAPESVLKTSDEKIFEVKTQNINFDEFNKNYGLLVKAAKNNDSKLVLDLMNLILK